VRTGPAGSALKVTWHDHDSGQYAEISLVWPSGTPLGLSHYLEQCDEALAHIDECIDWSRLPEAGAPVRDGGRETLVFLEQLETSH
jgi:hypothetical protein